MMESLMRLDERANVLLVDDQPARLMSYETILAGLGQNLICARSGVEALEQLMRHDFAVVLLDVSMPGMDGFELTRIIRSFERHEIQVKATFQRSADDDDLKFRYDALMNYLNM